MTPVTHEILPGLFTHSRGRMLTLTRAKSCKQGVGQIYSAHAYLPTSHVQIGLDHLFEGETLWASYILDLPRLASFGQSKQALCNFASCDGLQTHIGRNRDHGQLLNAKRLDEVQNEAMKLSCTHDRPGKLRLHHNTFSFVLRLAVTRLCMINADNGN